MSNPAVETILDKAVAGQRLSSDEALGLLESEDLLPLGQAARQVAHRHHPEGVVTYIVDRNVNYSNVCSAVCTFCAFYRTRGHEEAYVLAREEIYEKMDELASMDGRQVLMQGGLHPDLPLAFYEELLSDLKARYPQINLHAFSPPEIINFATLYDLSVREVIGRMHEAGLGSIPGGGAEILVDSVRKRISHGKCTSAEWLEVMETAHELGLRTTATMMFGHVETLAERVEHLITLRELQDRTGGFTAFICWTFQPDNTPLGSRLNYERTTSHEYLKTQAVARLVLDNIDNVQTSWVTQGEEIGQLGLLFGANDFGGTMLEENVVSAAGAYYDVPEERIRDLIAEAGFTPKRRTTFYELLE
ncbi:MAG: cyclic dehypoxanthinyl futalosine synthase [bacterium]|nr:cyclic dehypoxanthinyl futalosine synthase [bacterium]